MAATTAKIGFGYAFAYSADGTTWTTVAQVVDIKPPKQSVDKIKVKRNDSDTLYGETLAGWYESGEGEADIVYDDTQSPALFALLGQTKHFKITKPGTKGFTYIGFISEFGDEIPVDNYMKTTIKVAVSGPPTAF